MEGQSLPLDVSELHMNRWLVLGQDAPSGATGHRRLREGMKDMSSLLLLTLQRVRISNSPQSLPKPSLEDILRFSQKSYL